MPQSDLMFQAPMTTAPRFGSVNAKFRGPIGNTQPFQAAIGGLLRMFGNKVPPPPPQPEDPEIGRAAAEAFGIPMGQPSLLFPNAAPRRMYKGPQV